MTDDMYDNNANESATLNRLIRLSREKHDLLIERPGDDCILAYLVGSASDLQLEQVRRAMIDSAEFRREIVSLAQQVDKLGIEPEERKSETEIVAPSYEEFLNRYGEQRPSTRKQKSVWGELMRLRIPQLYAPLAAAAILVLVVTRPFLLSPALPTMAEWRLDTPGVEINYLIDMGTRDSGPASEDEAQPTSREAAILGFRNSLEFDNGQFSFYTTDSLNSSHQGAGSVHVQVYDDNNQLINRYDFSISEEALTSVVPELWLLAMPSRTLYLMATTDSHNVKWLSEYGSWGALLLTYQTDGGFMATAGQLVSSTDR